jgi:hypothetical protein
MKRSRIVTWSKLGIVLIALLFCVSDAHVLATQGDTQSAGALAVPAPQQQSTIMAYLPMLSRTYFEEYWYSDDFQSTSSEWPYGRIEHYNSHSADFQYGYKTDSDGEKTYHIRIIDLNDHVFVTGPAHTLGNFDFEAEVRRASTEIPLLWGDEYGIVLSPTPIKTYNPSAQNVYTFQIRLYVADDRPRRYLVKKWSITDLYHDSASTLVNKEESTYLTNKAKVWNKLRIVRTGNTLDFYLTTQKSSTDTTYKSWKHVYTLTDDALPPVLYIGFFGAHVKEKSYPIEFQFDNVKLHAYP